MKSRKKDASAGELHLPALRQFMRGYLHEDWMEEYDSAAEAAQQFWEDADAEERTQVAKEWKIFCAQAKSQPVAVVNKALREKLGAGWNVRDLGELGAVSEIFEGR